MKLKVLSLVVLMFGMTSCMKTQTEGVQVLEVSKYETKLKQPNVQLLDVRTPEEFSEGHLENAINIDVTAEDFDAKVAGLDKEKPVMVYCKSGGRSAKASARLKELGFKTISDLEGGITNWKSENKPVVK
ncbi:rhodanese-like domain-containing protein [Flavobacterium sp. HXWNR69]|uniref:Rhodanese-like domain-containing protein n=1 Tax=Flavobacterium fragile TaxID=2949085 RepID=A0ABT0TG70_9FLAO|nr:rhodanese-like domain-containing protein [Flavobacterium sp. HXWNR69]MCL9769985.1 rhodanese-like domain-containing protein [Flavobacterium sp. HXWNR69]